MNTPLKLRLGDIVALILMAIAVGTLFIKEPGLGDDFTYWSTAWEIHTRGGGAWSDSSFHDLRWPVWGMAWVFQSLFGPGLLSFYAVPQFYAAIGSIVIFALGLRIFASRPAAWACAIAFLFHPLLDVVIYRPMPDLSEGVLIAVAVLCWLGIVESEKRRNRFLLALGAGLAAGVLFSNRLTGVFVLGVLGAVAVVSCWKNPRFKLGQAAAWLGLIGVVWLAFVSLEGWVYYRITGDFFHSITANLGARGNKGTESIALWSMPFRFIDSFWKYSDIMPVFSLFALIGGWHLWRCGGLRGRVVVVWTVVLYLAYNCALQSLFPPRPLLREADRFLCALAIPLSILSVAGLWYAWSRLPRNLAWSRWAAWPGRHPVAIGALAVVILALVSARSFFNLGYVPPFAAYLKTVPPGSVVFTHYWMQSAAFLADGGSAEKLDWKVKAKILHRTDSLEKMAAKADEFWYCRKVAWLSDRKKIERNTIQEQEELGSYFSEPQKQWMLMNVVNVGGHPEYMFYRKRPAGTPVPSPIELAAAFPALPALPLEWTAKEKKKPELRLTSPRLPVPEALRGKAVGITADASSDYVQAATVRIRFYQGDKLIDDGTELRPYFHTNKGSDFHAVQVPAEADSCELEARISPKTKRISLEGVRLIVEP